MYEMNVYAKGCGAPARPGAGAMWPRAAGTVRPPPTTSLCVNEDQKPAQGAGEKSQEIFYAKGQTLDAAPSDPKGLEPIDLGRALAETAALSCYDLTYTSTEDVWILFYNQTNFDSLHLLRTGYNRWYVDTPVFCSDPLYRFVHDAWSDTRRIEDAIRMFFEEGDWHVLFGFKFKSWQVELSLALNEGRPHPLAEQVIREDEKQRRARAALGRRGGSWAPL